MEIRDLRKPAACHVEHSAIASFSYLALGLAFLAVAGCGAPGEPVPPSPPVPLAVTDLSAQQSGDGVELSFTLPAKTVAGDRLAAPPAVEFLRGGSKPDGSPDKNSLRVVYTIPGSLVNNYVSNGHLKFIDPIAPSETRAHPGGLLVYMVRTRASKKRASANSNPVSVRMFPVPEAVAHVEARVTESAIDLSWAAPTRTSGGDALGVLSGYRIYRGELEPSSAEIASADLSKAKWKSPLTLLAPSNETSYQDTLFDFGKTYVYIVRSVVQVDDSALESSDSAPAIVTPRDTFPPAAPQNVVAAVLSGATPGSVLADLSWSINLETDLAGYRVYRSEQQGTRGALITPDLLLAPAYRDTSVEPGHRYWYSVTAVDRAGNESEPSAAVVVDVAEPPS
ncbi:MAG: fibronectin type III domain-containing protein [Candidatus Acidiferrales bacterium]